MSDSKRTSQKKFLQVLNNAEHVLDHENTATIPTQMTPKTLNIL